MQRNLLTATLIHIGGVPFVEITITSPVANRPSTSILTVSEAEAFACTLLGLTVTTHPDQEPAHLLNPPASLRLVAAQEEPSC